MSDASIEGDVLPTSHTVPEEAPELGRRLTPEVLYFLSEIDSRATLSGGRGGIRGTGRV